jgi:GT2 family glycosyltransferase
MEKFISVIIPVHNAGTTIEKCLAAALSSRYNNFEVIVVDDHSTDNSVEIIKQFPCRLIKLNKHSGASKARNTGAQYSKGEILFFVDADCILQENTLAHVNNAFEKYNNNSVIIGGTYTPLSYDNNFFSDFQSVFINYSETKRQDDPDYVAAHAMAISAETFRESGGFSEDFLPIIEDVEFSHRLRRAGYKLIVSPDILVKHIFNYTLKRSLINAFRKSMFWTIYSLKNRDLFVDSGTASIGLKVNVASFFISIFLILLFSIFKKVVFLSILPLILIANLAVNKSLFTAFYRAKGIFFAIASVLYYILLYPIPVGLGAIAGILRYPFLKNLFNGVKGYRG